MLITFAIGSSLRFADFENIDTMITDRAPDGALAQALEAAHVEVLIA